MGWNTGFEIMEATVMGAYKLGVLDKKLLAVLMRPYAGTDIDSGGRSGIRVRGKEIEDVVCEVMGISLPEPPKLPRDRAKWTDAHHHADADYGDAHYKAWRKATRKFGW